MADVLEALEKPAREIRELREENDRLAGELAIAKIALRDATGRVATLEQDAAYLMEEVSRADPVNVEDELWLAQRGARLSFRQNPNTGKTMVTVEGAKFRTAVATSAQAAINEARGRNLPTRPNA